MSWIKLENKSWEPHPFLPIEIKKLISKENDGAEVTIIIVFSSSPTCSNS